MGRTVEPVILRVALYPFVPDRVALFEKLESRFECDHPGVNVVLVSSPNATDDYYADDKSAHKGFQYVSADVYEIDTILLAEFIALGKIAPISLPYDDFPPEAIKAVSRDLLPYLSSFIRRVCSSFAPPWGALRTRLV